MNQPTAVILTIEDGDGLAEMEEYFPTRAQAETFVYLLPYLMTTGKWEQVKAAIISPLEEVGRAGMNHS